MNALTFGLLITALSGFARGQSTQLVLAEVAAMLVVGFFFVRRQLTMPVPCCRSTCCVSHSSLSLSALPSAPSARRCWRWSPALFSAVDDGAQRSGDRSAANAVAVSDHGDGAAGRLFDREMSCRAAGAIGLLIMACGLFGLALLPSSPSDLDIIWRMALCGAGFGLFQSPNNHTIVASAPSHRSGGASGMLGTARLLGQSTGAALVALLFNLLGNNGTHTALLLAGTLAIVAALISGLRVTQPRAA